MKRIENFVKNLSKDELEYLKSLINKPVETTNEQLTEREKVFILNCLDYCDKQDDLDSNKYLSIKKKLIV
jgi:hypothetical protein